MGEFSGLSKVAQISVRVLDVERAIRFYRDTLGMKFLFQAPGMAFFDAGGTWLYLTDFKEPEFDHPSSILYFEVDDIETAHETLAGRGVGFRSTPHAIHRAEGRELWLADFRDSEGNTFALRQWKVV